MLRLLLFSAALLLAGCVSSVRPPMPPATADYFDALADDLPEQSDELLWIVQRLARSGRLSERDLHDFHAAFPDLADRNRPLTDSDRTALRGLR
jgi:hypothetical protein